MDVRQPSAVLITAVQLGDLPTCHMGGDDCVLEVQAGSRILIKRAWIGLPSGLYLRVTLYSGVPVTVAPPVAPIT